MTGKSSGCLTMTELFNTPFETSLRVLLTLRVFGEAMTLDKIAAADFMTIYARDFSLAAYNLNGDNSLSFSEVASKRVLVGKAIKQLVLNRLVSAVQNLVDTPLHGIDEGTKNETSESVQTALFQYFINSREMGQLIIVENERTLPNLDYNQNGVRRIIFTGIVGEDQCGFLHDCKFDIPQSPKE